MRVRPRTSTRAEARIADRPNEVAHALSTPLSHAPCCAPLTLLVVSTVEGISDSWTSVVGQAGLGAPVMMLRIFFRHARRTELLADRLLPPPPRQRTPQASNVRHPCTTPHAVSPARTLRTRIKKAKLRSLRSARSSTWSQRERATSASHSLR
jgi:hypothetical protein